MFGFFVCVVLFTASARLSKIEPQMGTSSLNNIDTSFQPAGRHTKRGLRRAEIEFQKAITSRKRCFTLGYTDTKILRYKDTQIQIYNQKIK